jgi:hypothetical protein
VRDYGEHSYSWAVKGAGAVAITVVPESRWTMEHRGQNPCWVTGKRRSTTLKFLPVSYRLKVEFNPCP